jgi:DNA repair photolyase
MIMKVKEIMAKSIITKSGLPDADFVINPYIGCAHGCKYCYARFMKRFTGHKEPWGAFVDVKINAPDLIAKKGKFRDSIIIGSVTDPYQPLEKKYELTRKILEKLLALQPDLCILTKSDMITRDIDLLKQFQHLTAAISLSMLDENLRRQLEPGAFSKDKRFGALKKLHKAGIKTVLFISPIFPEITDWKAIVEKTHLYVDEYWFENLNLYPSIGKNIYSFLRKNRPDLVAKYQEIYSGSDYWSAKEKEIRNFCTKNRIKFKIYFHHKGK